MTKPNKDLEIALDLARRLVELRRALGSELVEVRVIVRADGYAIRGAMVDEDSVPGFRPFPPVVSQAPLFRKGPEVPDYVG